VERSIETSVGIVTMIAITIVTTVRQDGTRARKRVGATAMSLRDKRRNRAATTAIAVITTTHAG
jgi:hypothetical protein